MFGSETELESLFWYTSSALAMNGIHRFSRLCRRRYLVVLATFLLLFLFRKAIRIAGRDLGYLLRPIWDTPPKPFEHVITHYYSPNMSPEHLCSAHGWTLRSNTSRPRVIDAFIFSVELDLLEIRLKELWDVVDIFVVAEADKTFTGKPKPLMFARNQARFAWANKKLYHFVAEDLDAHPKEEFQNEAHLRRLMNNYLVRIGAEMGDLIIVSDPDEIPSAHTLQLLKSCEGYPRDLHLELRNYLYSFEFLLDTTNPVPHVETYYNYNNSFRYSHARHNATHVLSDAGWHCSFCFRHISDFVFKMTSYSHSDRVTRDQLLDPEEIQRKICDGLDIFDMFPEAFTYKDLISQLGKPKRSRTTFGIPQYVVDNPKKFAFLLPGGCIRSNNSKIII